MRTIVFSAALTLLTAQTTVAADDDIVFAPKNFSDLGGSVAVSGTMTGDGIAYKNNTYAILCVKSNEECLVTHIEQIGPNQIGRLDYPSIYPIMSWTPNLVVASEPLSSLGCTRTTITIDRKAETALWVD